MTESKSNSDPTNNRYSFEDLVAEISSVEWFENVGSAVPGRIRFLVDKYLAGLGCTTDSIRMVRDVRQLEDCIKNNFDPTWMAAESTAFNNLLDQFDQSKYDETFNVEVQQVISNLSSRILMLADNRLTGSNRYLHELLRVVRLKHVFAMYLNRLSITGSQRHSPANLKCFKWDGGLCVCRTVVILFIKNNYI